MFALIAAVTTFMYGTLLGWLVHWTLHRKWSGFAHRAHMTHHLRLYPPGDLVSDTYRNAGKDNTTFIFAPLITVGFVFYCAALWALGASAWLLAGISVEALIVGIMHDQMHTLFHLKRNPLLRFRWFRVLREMHFYHHRRMNWNLGIFFFGWDLVFRTLRRT